MPILQHIFKKKEKGGRAEELRKSIPVKQTEAQAQERERLQEKQKQPLRQAKQGRSDLRKRKASTLKTEQAHGAYNVILRPHISEKSVLQNERGTYVFDIMPGANKKMVAKAIESLYGVEVEKVHTTSVFAKPKRYRFAYKSIGRPDKAFVTLKRGHEIEVLPQ